MKKLLLCAVFIVSSLFCTRQEHTIFHLYRQVPNWSYDNECVLPYILELAAWSAKYVDYNRSRFQYNHLIVFEVYRPNCIFSLRFNQKTRECCIEFNADDDSFDYTNFKKTIDFFFLSD